MKYVPNAHYEITMQGGFNDGSLKALADQQGVLLPWPSWKPSQVCTGQLAQKIEQSGGEILSYKLVIPESQKEKKVDGKFKEKEPVAEPPEKADPEPEPAPELNEETDLEPEPPDSGDE